MNITTLNIVSLVNSKLIELESKLLIEVLKTLLKREVTADDLDCLTKHIDRAEVGEYILAYNNLRLGTVKINYGFSSHENKIGIEFIPAIQKYYLEPML